MSDLISRAAVIEVLEECHLDKLLFEKEVYDKINAIPTAYDVDKVISELNEKMLVSAAAAAVTRTGMYGMAASAYRGERDAYKESIKIVKGGGVNNVG